MYRSKEDIEKGKVYIASPFFSPTQIKKVEQVEKALESNPFVEMYFSPMRNQIEALPFGSDPWRVAVFAQDVNNLNWANVVVAVADMDGQDTDSGTAFEVGYAFAKGIPVIMIAEDSNEINLMLSDSAYAYLGDITELEDYNFLKMPKSRYRGNVI